MARVIAVTPHVPPPIPTKVVLELDWDEFLLVRAEIGCSNDTESRKKAAEAANHHYGRRPAEAIRATSGASLRALFREMNALYLGDPD